MGYWRTPVVDGLPKFHDKPGCHWRIKPDGTQAIIEFTGTREDYDDVNADPDCDELTRTEAGELARSWNQEI